MTSASSRGCAAASLDSASRRAAVGGVDSSSTVIIRATRSTASCRICSAWSAWAATVSRVTSAVTKGFPSRSPPTHEPNRTIGGSGRGGGVDVAQRALDGPLEAGHRVHERLPEDGEHGLHLVGRGGPGDPQRRGALQDVDVLEHPAPGLGALRGARLGVVVGVEARGDPAQGRGHRSPPGLGGVRREHRVDPHPLDPGPRVGPARRHGGADVAGVGAATELAVLAPQRPGPLALLGEVGQVQVHREQPGDPLGGVGVERGDQLGRGVGVVGPAAGLQLVGDVEQVGTPGLDHHLSVQGGEEGQVVEHARHVEQPRVAPLRFVEGVRPSVEFRR